MTILIPPSGSDMESIDPLADKVGVLGGEFGSVEACNDADESEVALDVNDQGTVP